MERPEPPERRPQPGARRPPAGARCPRRTSATAARRSAAGGFVGRVTVVKGTEGGGASVVVGCGRLLPHETRAPAASDQPDAREGF